MTIKSMTGFARADGSLGAVGWHWELRSVNGRGLDVRLRLPAGHEELEPQIRKAAGRYLARGNVTINLAIDRREGGQEIRLNEQALAEVIKAAERVRELTGCAFPRADGLIAIKGVLENCEIEEAEVDAAVRSEAILQGLEVALGALADARSSEGERLQSAIEAQLAAIERLIGAIETSPARSPEAVAQRLSEQINRILETTNSLDVERLHQEAVMLATRADVEEEVQRVRAHIDAARQLLGERGAVGRKLDFLAQEFNREANTICSKANDVEITRAGLALKTAIDQMREQVQNIE